MSLETAAAHDARLAVGVLLLILIPMTGLTLLVAWQTRNKSHLSALWSVCTVCLWSLPVVMAGGLVVARAVHALRAEGAAAHMASVLRVGNDMAARSWAVDSRHGDIHRGMTVSSPPVAVAQAATRSESRTSDSSVVPTLPPEVRAWTAPLPDGSPRPMIVSSGEHPTVWDAEQEAVARARAALYGPEGIRPAIDIPPDVLEKAILRRHHEQIDHATDHHTFTMHRVHLQVAATETVRGELHRQWRLHVRDRRLWTLGGLTGLVVLMLGTCTAYLRLDRASGGRHRGPLKLVAVTLLTAASLALAICLPMG